MPAKRRTRKAGGEDAAAGNDNNETESNAGAESYSVSPAMDAVRPPPPPPAAAGGDEPFQLLGSAGNGQQNTHDVVSLLVQAANSSAKIFSGNAARTAQRLADTVETMQAVGASACNSVDQRNVLLKRVGALAAENSALRCANEALAEQVAAVADCEAGGEDGAAAAGPSAQQIRQQQQQQQAVATLSTAAAACTDRALRAVNDTVRRSLEGVSTAHAAALQGRSQAVSRDLERNSAALRVRQLEQQLAQQHEYAAQLREALQLALVPDKDLGVDQQAGQPQHSMVGDDDDTTTIVAALPVNTVTAQARKISELRSALRALEMSHVKMTDSSGAGEAAVVPATDASSTAFSLADSLRYLDRKQWTVCELVQRFRLSHREEERLRALVREQSKDVASHRAEAAQLRSELAQAQWKAQHLEELMLQTAHASASGRQLQHGGTAASGNSSNGNNGNSPVERALLRNVSEALNAKAAACVLLESTQRDLQASRGEAQALRKQLADARRLLDSSRLLAHFERAEQRRAAHLADARRQLAEAQEQLSAAAIGARESKGQYDALRGLVLALQESSGAVATKLRGCEAQLARRNQEATAAAAETARLRRELDALRGEHQRATSELGDLKFQRQQQQQQSAGASANQSQSQSQQQQGLLDAFTRVEKAALALASKLPFPASSASSEQQLDGAAAATAARTSSEDGDGGGSAATATVTPLVNFVLRGFNDALHAAERVRVSLLGQIADLTQTVAQLRDTQRGTAAELLATQQRLQQAEASLERSSGTFTSAVLCRSEGDDSALRIAELQRSVSKLEQTQQHNRLQADQLSALQATVGRYREQAAAAAAALATAEGTAMAALQREEGARRAALAAAEQLELHNLWVLRSLSSAAAREMASSTVQQQSADVGGDEDGAASASSSSSSAASSDAATRAMVQQLHDVVSRIEQATLPVAAVHRRLVDQVDSAAAAAAAAELARRQQEEEEEEEQRRQQQRQEEQQGGGGSVGADGSSASTEKPQKEEEEEDPATMSINRLCSVLDTVLSFWRTAAQRELAQVAAVELLPAPQSQTSADGTAPQEQQQQQQQQQRQQVCDSDGAGATLSAALSDVRQQLEVEIAKREQAERSLSEKAAELEKAQGQVKAMTELIITYQQRQ